MTFVCVISESRRLGRALGEERRRQGLTQIDLAAQACVSRGWLVRLEAGHGIMGGAIGVRSRNRLGAKRMCRIAQGASLGR